MTQPAPTFPGGMETAPEATAGGCHHDACLCRVQPGKRYCSLVCSRAAQADSAEDDAPPCICGHFGCSLHRV